MSILPELLEKAKQIGTEAVEKYGDSPYIEMRRIREQGIDANHPAVQSALFALTCKPLLTPERELRFRAVLTRTIDEAPFGRPTKELVDLILDALEKENLL